MFKYEHFDTNFIKFCQVDPTPPLFLGENPMGFSKTWNMKTQAKLIPKSQKKIYGTNMFIRWCIKFKIFSPFISLKNYLKLIFHVVIKFLFIK